MIRPIRKACNWLDAHLAHHCQTGRCRSIPVWLLITLLEVVLQGALLSLHHPVASVAAAHAEAVAAARDGAKMRNKHMQLEVHAPGGCGADRVRVSCRQGVAELRVVHKVVGLELAVDAAKPRCAALLPSARVSMLQTAICGLQLCARAGTVQIASWMLRREKSRDI